MSTHNQEKILVVRMDRIGDTLVTTPTIKALRKLFPYACIDFLARSFNQEVIQRNPYIDSLYILPKDLVGICSLLYSLRKRKYDAILVMNACSKSTSYMISLLGAKEIWGFADRRTRYCYSHIPECIPPSCLLEKDILYRYGNDISHHVIVELLSLVEAFAKSRGKSLCDVIDDTYTTQDMLQMDFFLDDKSSLIHNKYPLQKKTRIALFIGNAKKKHTRWPIDNFIELSERLLQHNDIEVAVCVGKAEEQMLQNHTRSFPSECFFVGGSLSEAGAFLQTVDCFITSSTSYMHVAGALSIPTISLLGGYTYRVWRLLGEKGEHILSDSAGVDVRSIPLEEVYKAICKCCSLEVIATIENSDEKKLVTS